MKELVKSGSKSFLHQSLWIDHLTVDQVVEGTLDGCSAPSKTSGVYIRAEPTP